jgi:hypothetical protein
VEDSLQDGLRRLGLAINDAVTGSEDVNDALDAIRSRGTEVFLVLEATICIRRGADVQELSSDDSDTQSPLEISPDDLQFLRRLRISVDLEDEDDV